MIREFIDDIRNIDFKIKNFMMYGFKLSFLILLFSCYVLALYSTYPISHIAFFSGLNIFKLALTCFSAFFVCGMAVNALK